MKRCRGLLLLALSLVVSAGPAAAQSLGPMGFIVTGPTGIVEGDIGTVMAVFDVELINKGGFASVDFQTQDGTATAGSGDYISMAGTLTFPFGSDVQQVMVPVVGDTEVENDEQFAVVLSNPVNEVILTGTAFATILNDDVPTVSIGDASVTEGDFSTVDAVFTVTLSAAPTTQDLTVDFATQDGTAMVNDNDYVANMGQLIFPAPAGRGGRSLGPISQQVTVTVNGDTNPENDETFFVNLSNVVGGTLVDAQGDGTIFDDDQPISISIGDASVTEGDAGTVNAVFTVTLSEAPSNNDVTVDFATQDGSATIADNDYVSDAGQLVFPAGFTGGNTSLGPVSQNITIVVNGDLNVEEDELYFVNLSNPTGGTIADGQGDGTILNDDLPELSIDDVSVTEGDSGSVAATFTVTLSDPPPADVTVDFSTRDGTATSTSGDYDATSGSLFFAGPSSAHAPAGPITQSITVNVNGDTEVEGMETFFVDLTNPSGATIADAEGQGTILDDDMVVISIGDVAVFEGDSGTTQAGFQVTLSTTSSSAVTVVATTRNGSATTQDGDYVANEEQLTFNPGQTAMTFDVTVRGDTDFEPDETFFVDLSSPGGGGLGDAEGQGTIRNDDEEEVDTTSEIRLAETTPTGEGAGSAAVTVQRTGGFGVAQVTVTATGGSADSADFDADAQIFSWADGETGSRTFEVDIEDDNLEEGDETVDIQLTNVSGAVVVGPSTRQLTILDNDMPMAVETVSDSETLSVVNSEVGMQVRVTRDDGVPVQGALVNWSVEGDAELSEGEETLSDAEGIAENMALLGSTPGTVVVTAALAGSESVSTFEITVEGDLETLVDPQANPGEASVARVLDESCSQAEGAFADACSYLFGLTDPAARQQALRELTPREASAQGTISLDAMRAQLRNVGSRLAALRGGATGRSVDQLALRIDTESFTLAQLTSDQSRADAAFLRLLEGSWWEDTVAEDTGSGSSSIDEPSRWGLFLNGQLSMGDKDETANEEGFDFDSTGVTAGLDYRVSDRAVFGGAVGFLSTDMNLDRRGGGLDAEGLSLSAYGLVFGDAAYFTGTLTVGEIDFDLERAIDLPEAFEGRDRYVAQATTDSDQLSIALEGGYDKVMEASTLGGFVRASYVDASVNGYSESGAGPFSLEIRGQDIESLLAETGLNWSHASSRTWGILMPSLRLSYLHEFEDASRLVRGRFVGDILGNEFAVPTDSPDRDFFNLGGGLTLTLPRGRSFYVFVDSDLERADLNLFTVSFGARFEL